ncbi:MAG: hypothetical protein ACI3W6_08005 [Clostridia bacterium]
MIEDTAKTTFIKDEIECEILFTTENPETGKKYMAYTDHSTDSRGHIRMYLASYTESENGFVLSPMETEESQAVINNVLDCILPELDGEDVRDFILPELAEFE